MNLKKILFLIILTFSFVSNKVVGQIFTEDFESGNGGYTSSTPEFTDGGSDYFTIDDGSTTSGNYGGASGSYFAAQDIDGEGASSQQTLTWSGIDISGCTSLQFSIDVAEDDDGTNQDWDENGDFLHIEISIDGGAYQNLLWFESTSTGFNSEPAEDTDFDGFGDGTTLTDVFQTFTKNIAGTGNTIDIRITFDFDSGDEDVAIDNLSLDGNCASCTADAEPTVQASNSSVTNLDCYTADLSWTTGNGDNTIVVLSDSPITGSPSDLTGYTANNSYGAGSNITGNEYVIYDGSGSTVSIAGLNHSTTYYYAIYTYNVTTPNCDENYLTSSVESGSFTTATCANTCPYISGIMFNSCGTTEGTDEYFTMQTGSDPINIDDIVIDFPNEQYCNSGCPDGGLVNNQSYIDDLNSTAACSPDLFVYADPIPPNSTVMVFTGNPPSTVLDFSSNCAAAPVYVIFTDNASTTGRFSNSAVRDLTVDWGGSCSDQTVTYDGSQASSDGGTVLYDETGTPSATYTTSTGCVYPLPIELVSFTVENKDEKAQIRWSTASETRVSHYQIYHSVDGKQWKLLAEADAVGSASSISQYEVIDQFPHAGINYYRLNVVDHDGYYPEAGIRSIVFKSTHEQINTFQNQNNLMIQSNFEVSGNATIAIYDLSGKIIYSTQGNGGFEQTIPLFKIQSGVYVVNILKSNGATYRQKVILNK